MIDLIVCELCGEEKIPTDTCIDCALASEKVFEDQITVLKQDISSRDDQAAIDKDFIRQYQEQVVALQGALKESNVLIDDQGRMLSPELYGKNYVEETRERIKYRGGSLAYGADVLQKNRALLAQPQESDNDN